jgi:hypothetical protein
VHHQVAAQSSFITVYVAESIFYEARVSFDEGRQMKEAEDHNEEFKKV